jgi:hypothetical protein
MVLIDNLNDSANQSTALQMPDGSAGTLNLVYRGSIQRWTFDFIHAAFPNGAIRGQMLCVHPNILRNFKNIIPFGLTIVSANGNDPVSVEDFATGNISIYLLSAADVAAVENTFYGILA